MKDVKIPTSDSWLDALIESLKKPEIAASYLEAAVELEAEEPNPQILITALKDVVNARLQMNNLSEEAKLLYEKLDKILTETGGAEIFTLVGLLNTLGFQVGINVKDSD